MESEKARLEMLRDWRRQSEAELIRVVNKLQPLEQQRAQLVAEIAAIDTLLRSETGPGVEAVTRRSASKVADQAYLVLRDAQCPLHYTDVLKRIEAQGFEVPGQEPPKNLVAHMSRDPRFRRGRQRGFYELADESVFALQTTDSNGEQHEICDQETTIGGEAACEDYDPFAEE